MNLNKRYVLFVVVAIAGFMVGCLAGLLSDRPLKETPLSAAWTLEESPVPLRKPSLDEQAAAITAAMTDEQKAGQMLMLGIAGDEVDEAAAEIMRQCRPGGIILFDRNMTTPQGVRLLVQGLQEINHDYQPVRLFVSIDEEGGEVVRMTDYLTVNPSAAAIGRSNNQKSAADFAAKTAAELIDLGINVNFAPVADLGLPEERSYSENPEITAGFVQSTVRAYERFGMISALKHFPGIGKADLDPHIDTAVINVPYTVLEREDLVPFRAAIDNLNNDAFMMMVSHVKYASLDKTYPASLSEQIMTEFLRGQLGFKGIIITDDLEMGGAANLFSFRDLGYMALKAGADIVLVCHDYEHQREAYEGILAAMRDGRLDEAAVTEKVRRIVRIKLKYLDEQEAGQ